MSKQVIKLTEQDLHNIIKESVKRIIKEYTGNFGYTDDNAPRNRPNIGTPEYYRRNDKMKVGQKPIHNDVNNWDNPPKEGKGIGDSKPYGM